MRLRIKPEAEQDIAEACAWYDERRMGLGGELVNELDEAFQRIRTMPLSMAEVVDGIRIAIVNRFPYLVLFIVEANDAVVIAVYHSSRNPREWRSRD